MHTDSYGRTWRFKGDHDHDNMLQLSHAVAAFGYDTNSVFRGANSRYSDFPRNGEPCLVKLAGKWFMGIRFSDSPADYESPGLDPLVIALMMSMHRRISQQNGNERELRVMGRL